MNYDDPLSGSRGGQIPTLTPEQRALAKDKASWPLAAKLYEKNQQWFTRHGLNLTPSQMSIVRRGCELGIFRKDSAKEYWRHTYLTRPWMLTALALRDEWDRSPEARAIKRAILPKTPSNGQTS